MCVAMPGKVLDFIPESAPKAARVSFSGVVKPVVVEWIPEVEPGDYVIVHAGFAINRMDEAEALKTLAIFDEMLDVIDKEDSQPPQA